MPPSVSGNIPQATHPFHKVTDEVDCGLALDLDCRLATLRIVEPCLGEPPYPESVGIYTHHPRYVETLYVDIPVGKRINQPLAQYG